LLADKSFPNGYNAQKNPANQLVDALREFGVIAYRCWLGGTLNPSRSRLDL